MTRTEDRCIDLPDGRNLGFCEYGDLDGVPIFFCHGAPGSRYISERHSEIAKRHGAHIITPDRPGYGLSDPWPERQLLDWPPDVTAVADSIGLDRFAVIGKSAGGPHAAACAYALGDRVVFTALCSSPAPKEIPAVGQGYPAMKQALLRFGSNHDKAVETFVDVLRQAFDWTGKSFFDHMQSTVSGPDARYLDDDEHQKALRAEYDEAYAQGSEGQRDDMQLVLEEWGFDISEISVPTIIWHGTDDEVVPTEMSKHLEEAIPGTRRVLFPKTGHFLVERDDLWDVLVRVVASHARENI